MGQDEGDLRLSAALDFAPWAPCLPCLSPSPDNVTRI